MAMRTYRGNNMITRLKNHSTTIFALLLLTMLVLIWLFPSSKLIIETIFLLFSFVIASSVVIAKNKESYDQGNFVRNTILDVFGILLAMVLAGLLANHIAQIAIGQTGNSLAKSIVAVVTGLLVGMGIRILTKRIWERIVITSSK